MSGIPEDDVSCVGIDHLDLVAGKSRQGWIQFSGKSEDRAVIIYAGIFNRIGSPRAPQRARLETSIKPLLSEKSMDYIRKLGALGALAVKAEV